VFFLAWAVNAIAIELGLYGHVSLLLTYGLAGVWFFLAERHKA